ncbi:acyl-CoA dehydrogenase family protein [Haliea sp.]
MSILEYFPRSRFPPEAEALRDPVRAFLRERMQGVGPLERARTWTGFDRGFSAALGSMGWLGLTFPERYGGAGRDAFARFVLVEELLVAGAPIAAHWIGDRQSGPLLLNFGTEQQREFYLPGICRGDSVFCIGMSEPDSGSDLASIRTQAVRQGDGWILNGSKIWTTYGHKADYMIALVRTTGTSKDRQKGLSQFILDLRLPGITARPIQLATGDSDFSEVHFDNVYLESSALIGEEGNGWKQVNAELAFERSGPERIYSSLVLLDLWIEKIRGRADARDIEIVGRLIARLASLRAMSVALTSQLAQGASPQIAAALFKDLGTEFEQTIPLCVANSVGSHPDLNNSADLMPTLAFLLQLSDAFSLRGGTREILRGMVARGLGLR